MNYSKVHGADSERCFSFTPCCPSGSHAFSTEESRAIRDAVVPLGRRLRAFVSVHAYGQMWMTPYGYSNDLPPNYPDMVRRGLGGNCNDLRSN